MTTLREVLEAAQRHVAVGHFNFSDLVTLRAVTTAARELAVPVMVGVSEGERAFLGVRQAAAAVKTFREEFGLPLFLNAAVKDVVRARLQLFSLAQVAT